MIIHYVCRCFSRYAITTTCHGVHGRQPRYVFAAATVTPRHNAAASHYIQDIYILFFAAPPTIQSDIIAATPSRRPLDGHAASHCYAMPHCHMPRCRAMLRFTSRHMPLHYCFSLRPLRHVFLYFRLLHSFLSQLRRDYFFFFFHATLITHLFTMLL